MRISYRIAQAHIDNLRKPLGVCMRSSSYTEVKTRGGEFIESMWRGTICALSCILFLTGCVEGLRISVADSGSELPIFYVNKGSVFSFEKPEIEIFQVNLANSDVISQGVMWSIITADGRRHAVSEITYGSVPRGFKEEIPPKPLVSGEKYIAVSYQTGLAGYVNFVVTIQHLPSSHPVFLE